MADLVIFDFDGTLFDTHESIEHSIKVTFETLLPGYALAQDQIHCLIASGAGLSDTFRTLHPDTAIFNTSEEQWVTKYREIYSTHGQRLVKAFPGAKQLLEHLQARDIPISIVSNKGVAAVKTALDRNGLGGYVPEALIVGDRTPGAERKPHTASFTHVVVPVLKERGKWRDGADTSKVLIVGDTVADIQFAKNLGCRVCWCRYGYGDQGECQALTPDFVVDSLADVVGILSE